MPQEVKNTGKKVFYAGRERSVYQGARGGLYVKKDGAYVAIPKKKSQKGGNPPQSGDLYKDEYLESYPVGAVFDFYKDKGNDPGVPFTKIYSHFDTENIYFDDGKFMSREAAKSYKWITVFY